MKTRIITALVAIAGVLVLLIFRSTFALPVVAMLLTALSAIEIFKAAHNTKRIAFYVASLIYLAAMPYVALAYIPFLSLESWSVLYALAFAVCLLFRFHPEEIPQQFLCFGMTLCVSYGFGAILRAMRAEHGVYLFFVGGLCAWMCDSGAYFAGTFFGKHKLCPAISPKKTVEGAVGGILSCLISIVVLALVYSLCAPDASVQYLALLIFALIGSVGGMVGDLFASAVKRCCGVKDFGTVFPGHGGVLDRVDSAIFVFPLMLIYHACFPLIV